LRTSTKLDSKAPRTRPPAATPEAMENQMISLAIELAKKQLEKGTASSQVITHFLKLGSCRETLEKELLVEQKVLLKAKTEQIQSGKDIKELYGQALDAMRRYSGNKVDESDD